MGQINSNGCFLGTVDVEEIVASQDRTLSKKYEKLPIAYR